ncbi:MAG: DNA-binding protein [Bacteroidaceae bacterium]|nr:DNA-binding protein [Bacteroidaceae bacterium]
MKETIKYSVAMRPNPLHENDPKKAYATFQTNGTVNLEELSEHIHKHGCVYSEGTILGVLKDMVTCTREALLEGNYVELGSLGKLKLTISSRGAVSLDDFSEDNILALNVIFEPGKGLQWDVKKDVDFEFTISRKAQAAARAAAKEGRTTADWTPKEEEEDEEP